MSPPCMVAAVGTADVAVAADALEAVVDLVTEEVVVVLVVVPEEMVPEEDVVEEVI